MIETVLDLGRYLGMPVHPAPLLPKGCWGFGGEGDILVSHDVWAELGIPVYDFEILTDVYDEEPDANSDYPQALAAE